MSSEKVSSFLIRLRVKVNRVADPAEKRKLWLGECIAKIDRDGFAVVDAIIAATKKNFFQIIPQEHTLAEYQAMLDALNNAIVALPTDEESDEGEECLNETSEEGPTQILPAVKQILKGSFVQAAVAFTESHTGKPIMLDVRPEATRHLGFLPGDFVLTPGSRCGTVVGANVFGSMYVHLLHHQPNEVCTWRDLKTADDFEEKFVRLSDEQFRFMSHAVAYPLCGGARDDEDVFLDVREASIKSFGFRPQQRVMTNNGFATVIGVDYFGALHFQLDTQGGVHSYNGNSFVQSGGVRTLTDQEEAFLAVAVRDDSRPNAPLLDRRPDGPCFAAFGFKPGDRVATPYGIVRAMGVFANGALSCECCFGSGSALSAPFELVLRKKFRVATAADEAFGARSTVFRLFCADVIIQLDTRAEAIHRCGFHFHPQEALLTPYGFQRVVGVNMFGELYLSSVGQSTVMPSGKDISQYRRLTGAQKEFLAHAVLCELEDSCDSILLDTRPNATRRFGLKPNQYVDNLLGGSHVVGVDVSGSLYFSRRAVGEGEKVFRALIFNGGTRKSQGAADHASPVAVIQLNWDLKHLGPQDEKRENLLKTVHVSLKKLQSASGVPPPGPQQRLQSSEHTTISHNQDVPPANNRNAANHQQRQQTVTLPCGSRYVGGLSKAGLRHGRGLLKGADGSWQFKGQWQRGLPHGSGTMRVGVGRRGAVSAEDVYEGQWACGVPHGPGTLTTRDGRRYRGKWQHGRRVMGGAELLSVRLSGGEAIRHRQKRRQKKKFRRVISAVMTTPVLCRHVETQQMTTSLAAACRAAPAAVAGPISALSSGACFGSNCDDPRSKGVRLLENYLLQW